MVDNIKGIARNQLHLSSLEEHISQDNSVRFIDVFVDELDLTKLQFNIRTQKMEGRPGFDSGLILKIYLYGYPWNLLKIG
jgi:transposase